jgi:hypothetical protein
VPFRNFVEEIRRGAAVTGMQRASSGCDSLWPDVHFNVSWI